MNTHRPQRKLLLQVATKWLAIGWAVSAAVLGIQAAAQPAGIWSPSKPVRIIVPIVGSTNDVLARLVAPKLSDALGQPVLVENKPGAGGNLGADLVAKSVPDGHTLLVGYNGPIAINISLFDKMPYDPVRDLAPITLAVVSPQYLVVTANLPVKNVADLLALSRARPGKLAYASVAVGSASHLTMEMLKTAAGLDITHIPYKGAGPAVTDLVAGNVDMAFLVPGNVQQFIKEGRLKLLATSGQKRFASTPDVPTLIELGYPDFLATSWIGFLAPAGTPRPIIDRFHKELTQILRSPEVTQRLQAMEFEVLATSPETFAQWISSEIPRWGKVIKSTGARVE
jgi:tripartite-type tricarboxylate transporter receptor subunit TctC